ncbi:hypothetical protein NPX99_02320 [Bartonella sp. 220]|nr:hypothetical protein [Bartonella sp. 220B]MCZ2158124.1 hypothetical protein [Bartonella sp. 220B]
MSNQRPFVNDIMVSLKEPKEQIIVDITRIYDLKAAEIKVF